MPRRMDLSMYVPVNAKQFDKVFIFGYWFFKVFLWLCRKWIVQFKGKYVILKLSLVLRRRDMNRKKAAQFLREGKRAEARECLARCVDVTAKMALELMKVTTFLFLNNFFIHFPTCQ